MRPGESAASRDQGAAGSTEFSDADGFVPLTTEIFDGAGDYLDSDAMFSVAPELILEFVPGEDGGTAASFDIVLVTED